MPEVQEAYETESHANEAGGEFEHVTCIRPAGDTT